MSMNMFKRKDGKEGKDEKRRSSALTKELQAQIKDPSKRKSVPIKLDGAILNNRRQSLKRTGEIQKAVASPTVSSPALAPPAVRLTPASSPAGARRARPAAPLPTLIPTPSPSSSPSPSPSPVPSPSGRAPAPLPSPAQRPPAPLPAPSPAPVPRSPHLPRPPAPLPSPAVTSTSPTPTPPPPALPASGRGRGRGARGARGRGARGRGRGRRRGPLPCQPLAPASAQAPAVMRNAVLTEVQRPPRPLRPSRRRPTAKPVIARIRVPSKLIYKTVPVTSNTVGDETIQLLLKKMTRGLSQSEAEALRKELHGFQLYRLPEDAPPDCEIGETVIDAKEYLLSDKELAETGRSDVNVMPTYVFQSPHGTQEAAHSDEPVLTSRRKNSQAPQRLIRQQTAMHVLAAAIGEHVKDNALVLPSTPAKSDKADNAVDELVLTEASFVADLNLVIEVLLRPLRASTILTSTQVSTLFMNMERIAVFHGELHRRLKLGVYAALYFLVSDVVDPSPEGISKLFDESVCDTLHRIYTIYMGHYEQSLGLFYQLKEEHEKFKRFLQKVASSMQEKSLNNLLMTPVQRVCKYELLLKTVISQHIKAGKKKGKDWSENVEVLRLQESVERLNNVIQSIDRRRAEADRWEKIVMLESKLSLLEPLRKRGRKILKEEVAMVHEEGNESSKKECLIIVFNDLLLRAVVKKGKGYTVRDLIPLSQLLIIDPEGNTNCSVLSLTNIDPRRGCLFHLHISDRVERRLWLQHLDVSEQRRSLLLQHFDELEYSNEAVCWATTCNWLEAYICPCRAIITTNHFCLYYDAVGFPEMEIIPFSKITGVVLNGTILEVFLNDWRGLISLTAVSYPERTVRTFKESLAAPRADHSTVASHNIPSPALCELQSMLMSEEDWLTFWKEGDKVEYEANQPVISFQAVNTTMYHVIEGKVQILDSNAAHVGSLSVGDMFGFRSFMSGTRTTHSIIVGDEKTTLLAVTRTALMDQLNGDQALLSRVLAMFGCKIAAGAY